MQSVPGCHKRLLEYGKSSRRPPTRDSDDFSTGRERAGDQGASSDLIQQPPKPRREIAYSFGGGWIACGVTPGLQV